MRKYLIALTVALMVCLLGVSASAETEEVEAYKTAAKEQEAIIDVYSNVMNEVDPDDLDLKTCIEIMTKAYEDAGWTVIQESPEVARSADIDPKILELAYSDIDKASQEQREKIIEAREIVINHSSWVNDIEGQGFVCYMQNMADREITFTPPYSEVFPGWDPPRPKAAEEAKRNIASAMDAIKRGTVVPRQIIHYFDDPDY